MRRLSEHRERRMLSELRERQSLRSRTVNAARAARRLALLLLSIVPATAYAGFDDLPFALRLFLSVDRQSNYASTLARQASVAALDGGSANPGAASWRQPSEPATSVTASIVDAPSSGGRSVVAAPVTLRWQAPGRGTLAFAYAYTGTRNAPGDDGLTRSLRSDEWIGGYGRRLDDHSAVGFTVRLTSGTIVADASAPGPVGDVPVRNTTRFLSPDVNVGYATDAMGPLSFGIAGGYGRARARTDVTNVAPLFVPIFGGNSIVLPPGSLLADPRDTISTYTLRGGVGFHATPATLVYVDATGLRIASRLAGSQNLGRLAVGAEHVAAVGWILRAGAGVDTIGQVNWSAGVGFRAQHAFEAQLAVQTNAAPEVNREIGRTRLVAGSLAWIF
jgi:hypothetical protein